MFETKAISRVSKKTGVEYICLEITFPNGYKKVVFLDKAEEYLVTDCCE